MKDNELKPCPFCGSTKLKIDSKRTHAYGGKKHCSVTVRCNSCFARSPVVGIMMPNGEYNERKICEEKAIEAWNNRYIQQGKWISVSDDDRYEGEYYCSICSAPMYSSECVPQDEYCYHCGAKMN